VNALISGSDDIITYPISFIRTKPNVATTYGNPRLEGSCPTKARILTSAAIKLAGIPFFRKSTLER
jgi:hypothetical protein